MAWLHKETVLTQNVGYKYVLFITTTLRKKISSELSGRSETVFKPLSVSFSLKTFVAFQRVHKYVL